MNVYEFFVYIHLGYRHLVLGQRSRFIRTYNADGSQGFNCRQPSYNCINLYHSHDAQCEDNGDNSRQSLRNGGNSKSDGCKEHLHNIPLLNQGDYEQRHAKPQSQHSQQFAQISKPFLQGSHLIHGFTDHLCDLTDLCVHPRPDNHSFSSAVCNAGRHVGHVQSIAQGYFSVRNEVRVFLYRYGLSRESRFFDFEVDAVYESKISRHYPSRFEYNDIAGNQLCSFYIANFPFPPDQCGRTG